MEIEKGHLERLSLAFDDSQELEKEAHPKGPKIRRIEF